MKLLLSQVWEGYLIHAEARPLSENTINDYRHTFERFLRWRGDVAVDQVTKGDIEQFMRSLNGLSKKTRLNYHIGLSALWTWLVEEQIVEEHIVRRVKAPKPEEREIVPFNEQDVQLLLASVERSKPYKRFGQLEPCSHSNPNALRNRTIIYVLLDTGIRASELCALMVKDVDLRNREFEIIEGKGGKSRSVYCSAKTAKLVWRYLATRSAAGDHDPLFASRDGLHLSRRGLEICLQRLGKKAGVKKVYPHRFRHTFAINYLRNGGDAYTLQKMLGHSDMTMTRRYLLLAREDVTARYHSASPVANWNLA